MITFVNVNKDPNELHEHLANNNCKPISLNHNAVYGTLGEKEVEATEIYIEIEQEKEELLNQIVAAFMAQ